MNKLLSFQLCYLLLTICLLISCKVKRPDNIIPESQMEDLLYDYHMAKALGDELPHAENFKKVLYIEAVLNKYNTDQSKFDSSLVWYTRNTELFAKMYERISTRLRTQRDTINQLVALREKKPQTTAPGDSVNIWIGEKLTILTGMPLDNKLTFTLPTDSNFKERDTLVWEVNYQYVYNEPDTAHAAIMAMKLIFENDSTISQTKRILSPGVERITLQSDTLGLLKEVNGFIFYPTTDTVRTLLASKINLIRYRCRDTLSVATRDSIKTDSIKTLAKDTLKPVVKVDTVKTKVQPRLNPGELNRRSNEIRQAKPEQIETERRIEQEKLQMQQNRRTNHRTQPSTNNTNKRK